MELNIFCGHFAGYVGAHYLNLPTTTQLEHRQSIFIDSYDSFSTVPKETTQLIDDLDADEYQKEERDDYSDDNDDIDIEDNDEEDSEDDDFSYGISNRRRRMRQESGNTSSRDISNDFMALYQSMLTQEQDKKTKLTKKDKTHHSKDKAPSLTTWSGKVTPIIQPQQSKRKYDNTSPASKLQELQRKRKRKQLREYVARATGIDASSENFRALFSELCDDTDDVMDDAMGDVTSSGRAWDLEEWGDLLAAPLHPRSLCPVSGAQDIGQRWGAVESTLLSTVEEESGECVRFFAEECDRVGSFKFVVDAQSGWGRVGETVLEYLREDFPKVSILCVPAHNFGFDTNFSNVGGGPSQQKRLQAAGASVCAALCAKSLSQLASLTLPLMSPFARFSGKISTQAKKELILRSEEKLSYDASPIALTLNALAAAYTPLPETLAFLSPVGTSVNAAVAELCVAPSPSALRGTVTSVPMTPFAENRLRQSDVISERAYSLVQGTRGLGGQPSLLAPSRAWSPREGTALVGGTREMLSPLMYFPSRMYGDVFAGCGMTSYGNFQSVGSAGIFHSSGEVFKYFDGLGRMVNEVVPRECLQMLLDDSTGSRMEVVDELSQIADDYVRF